MHPTEPAPAQALTGGQADAAGVAPEFRWPARGRIIQGFKAGGNDGINIAVPEGTSVSAAESGVVAYAGSELKGYGNLVLIRHPNGFVTAYANNGELDVKRGDTVKRGQIIAKSGQSGNVNSPQLHFELRKGSTPGRSHQLSRRALSQERDDKSPASSLDRLRRPRDDRETRLQLRDDGKAAGPRKGPPPFLLTTRLSARAAARAGRRDPA